MSAQEELDKVNQAISAIESGAQEYQIGSRRLRRADLNVLYQERRRLKVEAAEENGYTTTVAVFDRR